MEPWQGGLHGDQDMPGVWATFLAKFHSGQPSKTKGTQLMMFLSNHQASNDYLFHTAVVISCTIVAAMVTVTDLGFVLSKEQPPKNTLCLSRVYCKSVQVGDTTCAGKDSIYLCMVMISVDTSTVISRRYK